MAQKVAKYRYKQVHAKVLNSPIPQGGIKIGGTSTAQLPIRRASVAPDFLPASPGVDGFHNWGPFASGASTSGFASVTKAGRVPSDWASNDPNWGHPGGGGVGSIFPSVKGAKAIRNRKRGISPFEGFFSSVSGRSGKVNVESGSGLKADSVMKPGGIVDLNPGADNAIAGGVMGAGQASTLVRLHGVRGDRNMRLPVMPPAAARSGEPMNPAGGAQDAGPMAPLMPQVAGMPSIFGFFSAGTKPKPSPNTASHQSGCAK